MKGKSMVMLGLGAALAFGLTGCGNSPEKEYENLIRTTMKGAPAEMIDAQVKEALKDFKKMTPEEQKKELEKSKAFLEGMKSSK